MSTTTSTPNTPMPLYKVMGQDDQGQQIWTCYTFARTRKEAYLDVMGQQDRSGTWDADRIAESVEIDTEAILKLRSPKLLMRAAFDLIDLSQPVYCTRPALFDSRAKLSCTDGEVGLEVEFNTHTVTVKRSDIDRNLPISKYLFAALNALELVKYHITPDYLSADTKPKI